MRKGLEGENSEIEFPERWKHWFSFYCSFYLQKGSLELWGSRWGDKQGVVGGVFPKPECKHSTSSWNIKFSGKFGENTSACSLSNTRLQCNVLSLNQLLGKGYYIFCLNTHRNIHEAKLCTRVWICVLLHIISYLCFTKTLGHKYLYNIFRGGTKAQRSSIIASQTHSQEFRC